MRVFQRFTSLALSSSDTQKYINKESILVLNINGLIWNTSEDKMCVKFLGNYCIGTLGMIHISSTLEYSCRNIANIGIINHNDPKAHWGLSSFDFSIIMCVWLLLFPIWSLSKSVLFLATLVCHCIDQTAGLVWKNSTAFVVSIHQIFIQPQKELFSFPFFLPRMNAF